MKEIPKTVKEVRELYGLSYYFFRKSLKEVWHKIGLDRASRITPKMFEEIKKVLGNPFQDI